MPTLIRLSKGLGAVSDVGGRNVCGKHIGRLGGIGVVISIAVSCGLMFLLSQQLRNAVEAQRQQIFGFILGWLITAGLGFWDDISRLRAQVKIFVQLIIASILYYFGLRIVSLDLPFIGVIELGMFSFLVTISWVVGIVNAVNLIDGLDGLAAGVVFLAAIVNFVAAVSTDSIICATLMISAIGGILGFLLHNWYPAKIFLGDGGAYALGFMLSACGLMAPFQKETTGIGILVPILGLGLPICDTIFTIIRRLLLRQAVFAPDRRHIHHALLDSGISHQMVVIGLYIICCIFCSGALMLVLKQDWVVGLIVAFISIFGIIIWGYRVRK